jgi:hypothetical protein
LDVPEYAALLSLSNCFVYPSHGEGFGLQPLEAMATGLPTIAPAYGGLAGFIDDQVALPLPVRGEIHATLYERIYRCDLWWADIAVDDVADRMLWCYQHREEAAELGRRAAEYVAANWTWQQAGANGLQLLKTVLQEA